jgi:hypothetical protein
MYLSKTNELVQKFPYYDERISPVKRISIENEGARLAACRNLLHYKKLHCHYCHSLARRLSGRMNLGF